MMPLQHRLAFPAPGIPHANGPVLGRRGDKPAARGPGDASDEVGVSAADGPQAHPRYHLLADFGGFLGFGMRGCRHGGLVCRVWFVRFCWLGVTARVISGVASHIQVEQTEALHVSRIALMVREYLRSECVKELLSQAQDSSLTHSTLQLRATMSAIRHPCLIVGRCPSNFEGRNS